MFSKTLQRKHYSTRKILAIFIDEYLTPENNKISYQCRQLKRRGRIGKKYLRDGAVQLMRPNIQNGKGIKICHFNSFMKSSYHIETNQIRANQWTGFYMIWTSVMKELALFWKCFRTSTLLKIPGKNTIMTPFNQVADVS